MKSRSSIIPFAVTAALLSATLLFGTVVMRRIPESLIAPLGSINKQLAGWSSTSEQTLSAPVLRALAPSSYLSRTYQKGPAQLDTFVAYYAQQRAGESMHSPKHCLPGAGWEIWKHDSAVVPVNGENIPVNKYFIEHAGNRMLMFYWYQSPNRVLSSEYLAKVLLAKDTLLTGHTAGSIARIILPDTPGAAEQGVEFASGLIPEIRRCFGSEK